MISDLTKIVHQVVLNSQVPAKALAKEVGKSYSTLLREVNPYDTGAKLGVETLMDIMRQTGNVEPLKFMAMQFGFALVSESLEGSSAGCSDLAFDERTRYSA